MIALHNSQYLEGLVIPLYYYKKYILYRQTNCGHLITLVSSSYKKRDALSINEEY